MSKYYVYLHILDFLVTHHTLYFQLLIIMYAQTCFFIRLGVGLYWVLSNKTLGFILGHIVPY
jgi:hypothetical protein